MSLKVLMIQPTLAAYRVPVFRELASRPGIDLMVCYGKSPGLPNAQPDGFAAVESLSKPLWFGNDDSLVWHLPPKHLLEPHRCDVVVATWNLRHLSIPLLMIQGRINRIPVVLWGHGFSKRESRLKRWLRTKLVTPADAVVLYNYAAADDLIQSGVPREKVFVALNSLDQAPIQAARADWASRPDDLAAFRKANRLDTAGPVAIFCSRLMHENRVDLLITAAKALIGRHPGMRVVIIGNGPEKERLIAQAAALGLADVVTFTGSMYGEPQLAPWFLSSNVFVYPENIGLSVLHALGYGLPVVTSDRIESQNPEIEAIVPGRNGLLYKHGSLDALVDTIDRLATDRTLLATLSANALAQRRFSISRMVDGLQGAIRHAARSKVADSLPSMA